MLQTKLEQVFRVVALALLSVALLLVIYGQAAGLLKIAPRSGAEPSVIASPAWAGTGLQPPPAPVEPSDTPVSSPPKPWPKAGSPIAQPEPVGTTPVFAEKRTLSARFYGEGSSLFFNPKQQPGRISFLFTTDPGTPLRISGFELEWLGSLQVGASRLEVWPVPQKQITGSVSGSPGKYGWVAQEPFIAPDGAVNYTITFQAIGRGRMEITRARVNYLWNGQPRFLEAPVSGAVLWAQETWDEPWKLVPGDLFWSRFSVLATLGDGLYAVQKQGTSERFVLHYSQAPPGPGDTLVIRALLTGTRVGGLAELDATGPDGYVRRLPPP